MSVADLLFIFLVILALSPIVQLKLMDLRRSRTMAAIQKARGTRVVSLIHRQEVMALLGLPVFRYIDIADSEEILRAIRLTPPDVPIDFIVHTPGGLVLATEQIAFALLRHPAPVTIFVPHYAMSGGTLLALAADAIVMDPNAVLGPVDPQVGKYPAASILAAVAEKDRNEVDDDTLILADVSRKAIEQMTETVTAILNERLPKADAERLAHTLTAGSLDARLPHHRRPGPGPGSQGEHRHAARVLPPDAPLPAAAAPTPLGLLRAAALAREGREELAAPALATGRAQDARRAPQRAPGVDIRSIQPPTPVPDT